MQSLKRNFIKQTSGVLDYTPMTLQKVGVEIGKIKKRNNKGSDICIRSYDENFTREDKLDRLRKKQKKLMYVLFSQTQSHKRQKNLPKQRVPQQFRVVKIR